MKVCRDQSRNELPETIVTLMRRTISRAQRILRALSCRLLTLYDLENSGAGYTIICRGGALKSRRRRLAVTRDLFGIAKQKFLPQPDEEESTVKTIIVKTGEEFDWINQISDKI